MRKSGVIVVFVVIALSAGCQAPSAPPAPAAPPSRATRTIPPPMAATLAARPPGAPPFGATGTIRELMQSMIAPSAQGLWDSVGRVSDAKGTRDLEPRSDGEWAAVRRHAISLMESTNLLLMPGRHVAREGEQTLKADEAEPGAELP